MVFNYTIYKNNSIQDSDTNTVYDKIRKNLRRDISRTYSFYFPIRQYFSIFNLSVNSLLFVETQLIVAFDNFCQTFLLIRISEFELVL